MTQAYRLRYPAALPITLLFVIVLFSGHCWSQPSSELDTSLSNLYLLTHAQSRSISPENATGEPGKGATATQGLGEGAARNLGQGWKIRPAIAIKPNSTATLGEATGPGAIKHIWLTLTGNWRTSILRFYWDDETEPSVEVPVADFFASGWGKYAPVDSLAIAVNPSSGFNSYWSMPFRKKFRITLQNVNDSEVMVFYQIDYVLASVPDEAAYFHAQFRRVDPVKFKEDYTIVDGIKGRGLYVGTYLAWGANSPGWWGEGEIKFFIDGDQAFPTIAGTGTEDYFNGAWGFADSRGQYEAFSHLYSGMPQVIRGDVVPRGPRFSLYRWHIADPIRFEKNLKVTIQDLGWKVTAPSEQAEYLPLQDDIASTAIWYQTEPHQKFPAFPDRRQLETN